MKTKFNFKMDAIKVEVVGRIIETPQIDIAAEVETTITELKDLYELKKTTLKESPELVEELMLKFASLHKTSMKIVKDVENEDLKANLTEKSLDKWFKDLFMQKDVERNLITMYYEFCEELKIKPALVQQEGLNVFFKLDLSEKREFANRVTEYLVKRF